MAYELVVVGASLGGLRALGVLLAGLPADFPLPIVIVQHRGPERALGLGRRLRKSSALTVGEVEDKESIAPGHVYLAPAGYHLLIEEDHFALSTDAPVNSARPSIDVLFETAAEEYGNRVIGIILTGASKDGAQGVAAIGARGGLVIVQDSSTAESPVMPNAAIQATRVDHVLPVDGIAHLLVERCCGGVRQTAVGARRSIAL